VRCAFGEFHVPEALDELGFDTVEMSIVSVNLQEIVNVDRDQIWLAIDGLVEDAAVSY